jgi:hypothetical protein
MNVFKLLKYLLVDAFTFYGGGGKGGGSAPSYPDPTKVAQATTQTNEQTAAYNKSLNLNNFSNLFGSQQSTQTGTDPTTGAPIYSTQTTADPALHMLYSKALAGAGDSGGTNSAAMTGLQDLQGQYQGLNSSLGGLQSQYAGLNQNIGALGSQYAGLQGQLGDINSSIDPNAGKNAQQAGQDAAYKAQTQYLDPQFSQQGESLSAQLANQGLTPGSQAYNNAMLNFNNQKQQAYSNAANQAVTTGSQIGAQSLNNQLNAASAKAGLIGQQGEQVGNQAGLFGLQGQNLGQQAGVYGQQGSNLGAQSGLYGQQVGIGQLPYQNLGTVAGMIPGYTGTGQSSAAPADIAGLYNNQYQSQLAGYNANQQSSNGLTSGLFGLGAAALMSPAGTLGKIGNSISGLFSDRRLKRDIERIGTFPNGLPVYSYRYMWEKAGRHIGFMADEVRNIAPHAVMRDPSGFDRVDYVIAGGA